MKAMKKYILPFVCIAGLLTASCSQSRLDIDQKGVIPEEAFYITDEDAESAATAMYHGFLTNMCTVKAIGANIYVGYLFAFNLPGDDIYAACKEYGNNDFQAAVDEFRFDPSSDIISTTYRNSYLAIYYCNLITDHFKYGESAIKDRVISEARVMRAWLHTMSSPEPTSRPTSKAVRKVCSNGAQKSARRLRNTLTTARVLPTKRLP